ncbi:MAG: phosphosulfolactate synthase [Bacillota bacterium]
MAQSAMRWPLDPTSGLWDSCLWYVRDAGWPPRARGTDGQAGSGVTMVIDKGVPPGYFRDLLEVAAPHVQFWKLAFGSTLLYRPEQVAAKVREARSAGVEVYPGGTLLEMARELGQPDAVLDELRRLGFAWVEVSDGTFELSPERRASLIRLAVERGFSVISEVGSKDPARAFVPELAAAQVEADIACGARYVVIEARDTGQGVGVFNEEGRLRLDRWQTFLERLVHPQHVIWEAPRPEQQRELLMLMGPDVGLGNVQVPDIFTLAAMRWGLRADTLKVWAQAANGRRARVDGVLRHG